VTPSGIEKGPKFTGDRSGTPSPTEDSGLARTEVDSGCNECNEVLEAARGAARTVHRLAMVALNAVANGDVARARAALESLLGTAARNGRDAWSGAPSPGTLKA
jgi:hypothetical protein